MMREIVLTPSPIGAIPRDKFRVGRAGGSTLGSSLAKRHLLRSVFILTLLVLVVSAFAQSNAIILIRPEAVGRVIRPEEYDHGLWIQWPIATTPSGANRLLTPITGENWRLSAEPGDSMGGRQGAQAF